MSRQGGHDDRGVTDEGVSVASSKEWAAQPVPPDDHELESQPDHRLIDGDLAPSSAEVEEEQAPSVSSAGPSMPTAPSRDVFATSAERPPQEGEDGVVPSSDEGAVSSGAEVTEAGHLEEGDGGEDSTGDVFVASGAVQVDAELPVVEAAHEPEPQPTWDTRAYPPMSNTPVIGEAGRQPEIIPVPGPLTVGVADTELEFCSVAPFEIRACSTRGWSHRHSGIPRQDAFALAANDDWLVVALADGVSQGAHSHVAAVTAASAACRLVLEQSGSGGEIDWADLAGRISGRIVRQAELRRLIDRSAAASDADLVRDVRSHMSTTAVVALLSRRRRNGGFPATLAVLAGDSGVYAVAGDAMRVLVGGKNDTGDSAITSTAVRPLPGVANPEVIEFELDPRSPLVLTSDGLGDPLGDGANDLGRELARRWCAPPTAAQFFADVNFFRRTFDDDRTAVAIWVLPELDGTTDAAGDMIDATGSQPVPGANPELATEHSASD